MVNPKFTVMQTLGSGLQRPKDSDELFRAVSRCFGEKYATQYDTNRYPFLPLNISKIPKGDTTNVSKNLRSLQHNFPACCQGALVSINLFMTISRFVFSVYTSLNDGWYFTIPPLPFRAFSCNSSTMNTASGTLTSQLIPKGLEGRVILWMSQDNDDVMSSGL